MSRTVMTLPMIRIKRDRDFVNPSNEAFRHCRLGRIRYKPSVQPFTPAWDFVPLRGDFARIWDENVSSLYEA